MDEKNRYTTGEFAKRANISVRSIRYYDIKGLLKPAIIKDSGYRYYTDHDFAKLQRIIVLKKLGFSLEEIADISQNDKDSLFLKDSLDLQRRLIQDKILELKQIEQIIIETTTLISKKTEPEWNKMIGLIHLLNMKDSLVKQYKSSKNIEIRISLHSKYSLNPQGWFPWIFEHLHLYENMNILEVGCGNGQLWKDNLDKLPMNSKITLSDISSGMLRNAKNQLKGRDEAFDYVCFDLQEIPYESESFDLVIANHVLFYAKDREKALRELHRVLKKGGMFCCSTYGIKHLKEIELLAKEYNDNIALSEVKLYDIFGLDNAYEELSAIFTNVEKHIYVDNLLVTEVQPLAEYIYSCHGNQMEYLSSCKDMFEQFIKSKIAKRGLHITKDAGILLGIKEIEYTK